MPIVFTLNDKPVSLAVEPTRPLLWVLRSDLGLTGTKFGCGSALCGACTVLVGDEAVRSCATNIGDVAGKRVTTIEGLARAGHLHPLQEAFVSHLAFQCGFCTPGMILSSYALLRKNPKPTRDDVVDGLDANLCRCGSHVRVVKAVLGAAEAMTAQGGAR